MGQAAESIQHQDIIIVGAGISGIGAAWHFRDKCPNKSFTILEGRKKIGGTWSLFKYPGIRSDSDMHTLGYKFKPWLAKKSIADASSIMSYLDETVAENSIEPHIKFEHTVAKADWSSQTARWTVTCQTAHGETKLSCNLLYMCSGYYDYNQGYSPDFKGANNFKGPIIHPQHWPEALDYSDKNVIVIGSGATAVTIVPSIAEKVRHVTMLQRSPSYMIAAPDEDWLAKALRIIMPNQWAYNIVRAKNIYRQHWLYTATRKRPKQIKNLLLRGVRKALRKDYDITTHFTPDYNPWDQRLCLVPNGDLFEAINSTKASIVTDHIDRFTETGIALKSGDHIDADIIITATGLNLKFLGGAKLSVDGRNINPADSYSYEGMMYSDVPNMVTVFGYVNYSWTLRADLVSEFVCNLLNHMDATQTDIATPQAPEDMPKRPWIDFDAGYIQRVMETLPKQGDRHPWLNTQNYIRERKALIATDFPDIEFVKAGTHTVQAAE